MKISTALGAVVLAATMGVSSVAMAGDSDLNSSEPNLYFSPRGASGVGDLGVDITQAGSTPQSVAAFLAEQPPRIQEILHTACHYRMTYPTGHTQPILSFCRIVVGL